ncbi:MAG: AAA family ATPase [Acidobacteria bacterium]|nr:AAA family ATPase [Acidobacteriota bacterium]
MIRFLSIRHLAVIDALELEFEPGFTVLTGETGAGKSILVEAVGLLVGGRASPDLVRTGEEAATIQAIFDTSDGRELIVRREISAQGRSRAFLDGALATSAALRDACGELVDLHGQHEHQLLLDPDSHIGLLDEHARLGPAGHDVAAAFARWRALRTELDRLRMDDRQKASRLDTLAFQLAEIDRATPAAGEDEELATIRQVLGSADRLSRLCGEAYDELYEGDGAALSRLGTVWRKLADLASVDPRFRAYLDGRDAIKSQLDDLAFFLRSYAANIDASPQRLQEVEDRLALLERLKKKHGPTLEDVLTRWGEMRQEAADLGSSSEHAREVEAALAAAATTFRRVAGALSNYRRAAAPAFARALEGALASLAMDRTRCEVRFAPAPLGEGQERQWTARGVDLAEFYISPNPGSPIYRRLRHTGRTTFTSRSRSGPAGPPRTSRSWRARRGRPSWPA